MSVRCMGGFLRRFGGKMVGKGPIALSDSFIHNAVMSKFQVCAKFMT